MRRSPRARMRGRAFCGSCAHACARPRARTGGGASEGGQRRRSQRRQQHATGRRAEPTVGKPISSNCFSSSALTCMQSRRRNNGAQTRSGNANSVSPGRRKICMHVLGMTTSTSARPRRDHRFELFVRLFVRLFVCLLRTGGRTISPVAASAEPAHRFKDRATSRRTRAESAVPAHPQAGGCMWHGIGSDWVVVARVSGLPGSHGDGVGTRAVCVHWRGACRVDWLLRVRLNPLGSFSLQHTGREAQLLLHRRQRKAPC